jgi:hypothetical protein
MTTIADEWLEAASDTLRGSGSANYELHGIAVGSGTGSEQKPLTGLATEEYRSYKTNNGCRFVDTGQTGEFEAQLEVTGGGSMAEVPDGTTITEIMVFAHNNGDKTDTLKIVAIDELGSGVTIGAGETETFAIEGNYIG